MKKKGRIIATSIASIAMCASLIAGGTYALFTSESAVNVAVTSGTVKVVATASEATLSSTLPDGNLQETTAVTEKNTVTLTNFVPGDKADFTITVSNESTVSVQYRTIIKCEEDDGLFSGLVVDIGDTTYNGMTAVSPWAPLASDSADEVIEVSVSLPEDRGDEYQNKSCKLSYTVEAVQGNASVVDPLTKIDDTHYEVNNEWGMQLMSELANATPENYPVTETFLNFKLTADLDMTGYDYAPTNRYFINFDGDNHTISNLTAGYTTNGQGTSGLFGYAANVSNVTLENISVAGDQAGLIVARAGNNTISNVTIMGKNTVEYKDVSPETWTGVGAFVGVNYEGVALSGVKVAEGATITLKYNGMMTECDYTADSFGGCFGANGIADAAVDNKGAIKTEGEWYKKLSDGFAKDSEGNYVISSADGLKYFANTVNETGETYKDETVKLVADIDLEQKAWTPIGTNADASKKFYGTFDGQDFTISNLTVEQGAAYHAAGLFGALNGTAKNFTIENATVSSLSQQKGGVTDNGTAIVAGSIYTYGAIDRVTVKSSKVSGNRYVGGIAGYVYGSITNCTVDNVKITATPDNLEGAYDNGDKVGGIAGYFASETMYVLTGNTVKNGTQITGYRDIGGIAGCGVQVTAKNVSGNTVENASIAVDWNKYYADKDQNAAEIVGRLENTDSEVNVNANNTVKNVSVTPWEGIMVTAAKLASGITFESGKVYHFVGEFTEAVKVVLPGKSKDLPNGAEITLDGALATFAENVTITCGSIGDNYTSVVNDEKAGSYLIQNFHVTNSLSIGGHATTITVQYCNVEMMDFRVTDAKVTVKENTIIRKTAEELQRHDGYKNKYTFYVLADNYTLIMNGNTIEDEVTANNLILVQGNYEQFQKPMDTDSNGGISRTERTFNNSIEMTGNTLKANGTVFKVFNDVTYAPVDNPTEPQIMIEMKALTESLLAGNTAGNVAECGEGASIVKVLVRPGDIEATEDSFINGGYEIV